MIDAAAQILAPDEFERTVVSHTDPELRAAPAAFRTAVSIARRNWDAGVLTFELPSGYWVWGRLYGG